jgi:hypothetical protein
VVKSGFINNYSNSMVALNDVGAEVATLLTGPAWSGQRAVEFGSMVTADEVADQLGEVLNLLGIPKGHTGPITFTLKPVWRSSLILVTDAPSYANLLRHTTATHRRRLRVGASLSAQRSA